MNLIPKWLRSNFRIKAGLFVLATLLWFLVVSQRTYEHVLAIPIHMTGLKSGKVLVNQVPQIAQVKFEAQGRELIFMKFGSQPYLNLDLSTINSFYSFKLKPDLVEMSSGMNAHPVEIIEPDSIEILLDERLELKLPVVHQIAAKPADGYTLIGGIEIEPTEVTVTGPRTNIVRLESLKTRPHEMEKVKRNTDIILDLEIPEIFGIKVEPESVKGSVRVERLGERKIERIPLIVINEPRGRQVVVDPLYVSVEVKGGISMLSELTPDSISAWVNFREYDMSEGGKAPVRLKLPEKVEVKSINPEEVRLIVRRK